MVGVTTAAIIILLSGGGDVEHYLTGIKKNVKNHVADKDRRALILDESKQLSKDLKALGKIVDKHIENLTHTHANFQSLEEDFDGITANLLSDQKQASKRMLDARDVMHEQMTREEWEAVFKQTD
jgi:hypothetical protein